MAHPITISVSDGFLGGPYVDDKHALNGYLQAAGQAAHVLAERPAITDLDDPCPGVTLNLFYRAFWSSP